MVGQCRTAQRPPTLASWAATSSTAALDAAGLVLLLVYRRA